MNSTSGEGSICVVAFCGIATAVTPGNAAPIVGVVGVCGLMSARAIATVPSTPILNVEDVDDGATSTLTHCLPSTSQRAAISLAPSKRGRLNVIGERGAP